MRLASLVIFLFSSSTTTTTTISWEQEIHRAHWTRRQSSKASEMNSPKGLFWGLEGRSLGVQTICSPFPSLMLSVIPCPLQLAWEKMKRSSPSSWGTVGRRNLLTDWKRKKEEENKQLSHYWKKNKLQERGGLEGAGHETSREPTNVAMDVYICGERATMAPTEDTVGTRQLLPRDSGSIQQVPAAEKYVEITCCRSAKYTRRKNGWVRKNWILYSNALLIGKLLNTAGDPMGTGKQKYDENQLKH